MKPRKKLGELLVQAGVLDDFKLKAALAEQQRWGGRLGRILISMNFLTEEKIVSALSAQLAIPITDFTQLDVPAWLTQKIDMAFARANSLCPERVSDDTKFIVVAMADPVNVMAIDEIMHRTGMRVQTTIAGERAIDRAIGMVYGEDFSSISDGAGINMFLDNQGNTHDGLKPLQAEREATEASGNVFDQEPKGQSQKAVHAMVNLLIDKGVFTREEFLSRLQKR